MENNPLFTDIYRVLYIPGGAGFLPSTVSWHETLAEPPEKYVCPVDTRIENLETGRFWRSRVGTIGQRLSNTGWLVGPPVVLIDTFRLTLR